MNFLVKYVYLNIPQKIIVLQLSFDSLLLKNRKRLHQRYIDSAYQYHQSIKEKSLWVKVNDTKYKIKIKQRPLLGQ